MKPHKTDSPICTRQGEGTKADLSLYMP